MTPRTQLWLIALAFGAALCVLDALPVSRGLSLVARGGVYACLVPLLSARQRAWAREPAAAPRAWEMALSGVLVVAVVMLWNFGIAAHVGRG